LRVPIPLNVDPAKVTLTVKGRDVILRFEDRFGTEDCVSRVYFYNRCQLPDNTDLNKIKCCADKHRLIITAPLRTDVTCQSRQIPIQRKIRHKTLLSTGQQDMNISSSRQKQLTQQQQQQKKKNVLSSTSRSKSPITTEQKKKSSIKSSSLEQKQKSTSPIKSSLEQQKQRSPIKDTTSTNISGKQKQKKSTITSEEKTGSDILRSVFGSGQSEKSEKKQKGGKSSSDVKSDSFPLLPSDKSDKSEGHHQQ